MNYELVPERKPLSACFGNDEGIPETSELRRFGNSLRFTIKSFPKQNFGFPFRHYLIDSIDKTIGEDDFKFEGDMLPNSLLTELITISKTRNKLAA